MINKATLWAVSMLFFVYTLPAIATTLTYQYDAWNHEVTLTNNQQLNRVDTYDHYNSLATRTYFASPNRDTALLKLTYGYNKDNTLTLRIRTEPQQGDTRETYAYDHNQRLVQYTCTGTLCPHDELDKAITQEQFTFDAFNNLSQVTRPHNHITYDYDAIKPTRLHAYHNSNPHYPSSASLVYDANGNITADDHKQHIAYTPFDQIAALTIGQEDVHYTYDGDGIQVAEARDNQKPTYFIYGQPHWLTIQTPSQSISSIYGTRLVGVDMNHQPKFYLTTQSQSVLGTINAPVRYAYSPYGTPTVFHDHTCDDLPRPGFKGQLADPKSHWQFLGKGHRAYNADLGRFMHPDTRSPFGKGGLNPYSFASGNPIMNADPSGQFSVFGLLETLTGASMIAYGSLMGLNAFNIGGIGVLFNGIHHMLNNQQPKRISEAATWVALDAENVVTAGFAYIADLTVLGKILNEVSHPIMQKALVFAWGFVDLNLYQPYEAVQSLSSNPQRYFDDTLLNWAIGLTAIETDVMPFILGSNNRLARSLRVGISAEETAAILSQHNQAKFSHQIRYAFGFGRSGLTEQEILVTRLHAVYFRLAYLSRGLWGILGPNIGNAVNHWAN